VSTTPGTGYNCKVDWWLCGHQSLTKIVHFVPIVVSAVDPDSTVASDMSPSRTDAVSGHELLTIIIRYALILVSTLDPTSRFLSLGGDRNIAAVRTTAAPAAGQVLKQTTTILKNSGCLFCCGAPTRDRTWDLLLKRELLYRLSYRRIDKLFCVDPLSLIKG
jgi:hypothetical protein